MLSEKSLGSNQMMNNRDVLCRRFGSFLTPTHLFMTNSTTCVESGRTKHATILYDFQRSNIITWLLEEKDEVQRLSESRADQVVSAGPAWPNGRLHRTALSLPVHFRWHAHCWPGIEGFLGSSVHGE